jgi:hypothetical protein
MVACCIAQSHARAYTTARTRNCVMLIAFPRQQWFRERALMLRYTHTACLVSIITLVVTVYKPTKHPEVLGSFTAGPVERLLPRRFDEHPSERDIKESILLVQVHCNLIQM